MDVKYCNGLCKHVSAPFLRLFQISFNPSRFKYARTKDGDIGSRALRLCMCVSVCVCLCLSVSVCISLSLSLSLSLCVCVCVYRCVCLPACLPACLPVSLYVCCMYQLISMNAVYLTPFSSLTTFPRAFSTCHLVQGCVAGVVTNIGNHTLAGNIASLSWASGVRSATRINL